MEIIERFIDTVKSLGDKASIVISQVDPDAVGSAVVLSKILELLSVKANIYYSGNFGHPQNRSIANKFDLKSSMSALPIDKVERAAFLSKLENVILVDSSLGNDDRLGASVDPKIVIDHHRGSDLEEDDGKFFWIEDVGSACTLVTELIIGLSKVDPKFEDLIKNNKKLAILITLGIHTDTGALVSAGQRDHEAYKYVTKNITPEDISQLIHYTFPPSHFRNMKRALKFVKEKDSRLIANLGTILEEERDDLSTIAEWFLRKDGISLVIVWGIVGDSVQISARCSNLSIQLDEFLKSRIGSGGAKLNPAGISEGGALISLSKWMGNTNQQEVISMVSKRIEEWILGDLTDESK